MKIGLDVHGVCDLYSDLFRSMSFNLMMNGHEIHIITGQEWEKVEPKIKDLKISYSHHFSIVDYHLANGTKTWKDAKGTFWMDEKIWVRSKGDYIHRTGIDIHFDDSYEYAEYCPESCTFVLVPKTNFDAFSRSVFTGFTLW